MAKRNVGILLFNNVELLDFAGPFEVFSVASELNNFELFNVFAVAKNPEPIETINGLSVNPKFEFSNCPQVDILLISGGFGTRKVMIDNESLKWIEKVHQTAEHTLSVCTGVMVLAKLGLLDGQNYTTHHLVFEEMDSIAPQAQLVKNERFVKAGKIYTAAGITAGIDLSLHLVEILVGKKIAMETADYMEYLHFKNK